MFDELKKMLVTRPILTFPDYDEPFHIFSDASNNSMGAALMQLDKTYEGRGKSYQSIGYWSRIASATERKWPAVQLELCAALRHFAPYVYGTK